MTLEKKSKQDRIVVYNALKGLPTQSDLRYLLVDQTIDCIRIKNVIPNDIATTLSKNAINNSREHDRIENLSITGNTHYHISHNNKEADKNFDSVEAFSEWVQQNSGGSQPLEKIIKLFATMHEQGIHPAVLNKNNNHEVPQAIFRVYDARNSPEILPHQDIIQWDIDTPEAKALDAQAGWNLYLDIPTQGGELLIYDNSIEKTEYEELAGDSYGIPWGIAGKAAQKISPEIGELIIIDTRRLHAIKTVSGEGYRVTLSGFLGYSENRGLISWA